MIIPGANRTAAKANWVQSGLGSIIGEVRRSSSTEYLVLNDQNKYDTAIRGSLKTGEGNNIYGDTIKCPARR